MTNITQKIMNRRLINKEEYSEIIPSILKQYRNKPVVLSSDSYPITLFGKMEIIKTGKLRGMRILPTISGFNKNLLKLEIKIDSKRYLLFLDDEFSAKHNVLEVYSSLEEAKCFVEISKF